MASQSEKKPTGAPLPTAAEVGVMLDRVDRAKVEGEDPGPFQQLAWEAAQALRVAAEAGDASAMPAMRVILDRRPNFFRPAKFEDIAPDEAAMLACARDDLLGREFTVREIRAVRDELAGPRATMLERLLAERVALTWFDAHRVDILNGRNELAGCSQDRAEFLSRQRSRSQARFLAAAKSLATVQRLAMPVLHLHRDVTPPTPDAVGERFRVVADGSH